MHGIHGAANGTIYCPTKFALSGFKETLSKEVYKDGIKVSLIFPGGVLIEFGGVLPEKRNQELMEPEEIARVVLDVVLLGAKTLVTKVFVSPKAARPLFRTSGTCERKTV